MTDAQRSAPAPTSRLACEALTPSHASELAPFLVDPRLWRWIPHPPPTADEVARRFERIAVVQRPNGDRWENWVVRRRADGQAVGLVEVTVYPTRRAHFAYFVFVPYQGRGYAREACGAVLAHLHDARVTGVEAFVDTRNEPSQRLLASLRFTRDEMPQPADPIGGAPAWDYRYALELSDAAA